MHLSQVVHKESGACTQSGTLSRLSLSFMPMATNADQRKWRQIHISAVSSAPEIELCLLSPQERRSHPHELSRHVHAPEGRWLLCGSAGLAFHLFWCQALRWVVAAHDSTMLWIPPAQLINFKKYFLDFPLLRAKNPFHHLVFPGTSPLVGPGVDPWGKPMACA